MDILSFLPSHMFMGRISIARVHTWFAFVASKEEFLLGHLVCICRVQGGVPPRTFFPSSPTDETCNVDHLSHLLLLGLVSVLGQCPRPNTLFWALAPTIAPQNSDFSLPSEEESGVLIFQEIRPTDIWFTHVGVITSIAS